MANGDLDMDGIVITGETLRSWRKELEDIDSQIKTLNLKRSRLSEQLGAADILSKSLSTACDVQADNGENKGNAKEITSSVAQRELPLLGNKVDLIMAALREHRSPMSPKEIREYVANRSHPDLWGKNGVYLYQTLKRMSDNRRILKTRGKYTLP
jgi:hypothetical protein